MKTEIEARFLDIDTDAIRAKLRAQGASLVHPEGVTRQKIFDYPDFRLDKDNAWLRLRDENATTTLTLKKWEKEGVDGMKEIEFTVGSFEETERLLLAIGMMIKSIQTKKRELWKLDDVEFMIDTWPWIPTFLEIEGSSEKAVRSAAQQLGFDWKDAIFGGAGKIYKKYFAIESGEIDHCPKVEFTEVPNWLEEKRIKPQPDRE